MKSYKIGTRGSLLAVTQSTLMKNRLEEISGDKFELVTIKTQGDEITSKPLWQLEGKDFFTKELDEALLRGDVDLVIHSYKDLGSVRPEGIKLAAVTERTFAHDILLIPHEFTKKLKNWEGEFVVGTSSPRRIANLTHSLKNFLPQGEKNNLTVRCEMLRGNVNSRIKKLKDGNYHAITLALAGLERLAMTEKSAAELRDLLDGLNFLILPQSVFPAAASQGALGLEVREGRDDQGELLGIVSKLSHARTVEEVSRERKAFKDFGGGCHLAVGIHVKKIGEQFLHVHSGEVDGKRVEEKWMEGPAHPQLEAGKKLFIGLPHGSAPGAIYDQYMEKNPQELKLDLTDKNLFVTSRYCIPTTKKSLAENTFVWAAGTKTFEKLVQDGIWVNGSSDSLGTEELKVFKNSKALKMLSPSIDKNWTVLSHETASSDIGEVVGTYKRVLKDVSPHFEKDLQTVGACYWTSYPQYEAYAQRFPFITKASHFCGLGKTWQEFKERGISVVALAKMQDFTDLAEG